MRTEKTECRMPNCQRPHIRGECDKNCYYNTRQVMTNADRIRAMSDEELAVQIAWPYLASPPWCSEHTTCPYISEDPTPCDKCALDWLKQEATDAE